jgi:hypothetical protein
MAKLFASWVPGYSTVAQNMGGPPLNWNGQNYTDANGHREGFGVHFYLQGNQANWFHVPCRRRSSWRTSARPWEG